MSKPKPVVLLILDGWGHSQIQNGNAIACARTPTWDHLLHHYPHTLISGSGEDVGLPDGQMGNSEVGHLTIGAGRVIYQDLTRISKDMREGHFFQQPVLQQAFIKAKQQNARIHVLGLLSPGGVHSHEDHIFSLMKMAQENEVPSLFVHAFLDGRDMPPQSAKPSIEKLMIVAQKTGAQIATIGGRYYGMDRDQRWDRVQLAYDAIVHGRASFQANSALEALNAAYERQETDEFVKPTCIVNEDHKTVSILPGDIVIYMNFRSDRARALSYALTQKDFSGFARGNLPDLGEFITLTQYDKSIPAQVVFPPQVHQNVLAEYLQNNQLTQCHIAETEKYAHVTFFFNGGLEKSYVGEERILVPSPKVATYDLQPEMSAFEVTTQLVAQILQGKFDFIVCNYANADMVGHTGNYDATIKAIETLDLCLGRIFTALTSVNGEALITSDHGNAECMTDDHNLQPHTAHTTSLVPLVYFGKRWNRFKEVDGTLSDVAPTLLQMMQLEQPIEMTGHGLLEKE